MDVASLRWFQQVADGVTVTEVSDLDQVSQSGVSRALARLEREVGAQLLRRSGRQLRMTRAGATFKRYVDKMLHDLDDGLAALSELTSPESGTVAIAFQPSLGGWLVPELVASFRQAHPHVRFVLHQVVDELTGPTLWRGEADVEITTLSSTVDTVRWRPLMAEPLQLAVPAGHPLAARASVRLAEVAADPFVMLNRTFVLRRTSERLCDAAGFAPTIAFEGDDLSTATGFVAARLGVAIVPMPRNRASSDGSVRYLSIEDEGAVREIGIAWSTERRLLPAATAFRDHVVDQLSRRGS
jgi:DNA-binding transcriptional LysR family regulator